MAIDTGKRRVYCIEWDTDGVPQEELGLPAEVLVPSGLDYGEIGDWLSGQYGWCVCGFRAER